MAISEIPAKMVESAANLTGKKMEVARDLFKIAYEKEIPHMAIQEMVEKYKEVFDLMKDISPPEQEQTTHFLKRHHVGVYMFLSVISFTVIFALSFLFHKYVDTLMNAVQNMWR
jgi:hypothetical protein